MKRGYLLIALLFASVFMACDDDDPALTNIWMEKNTNRVKEITGHNDWWGDFRMECFYKNEKLDTAWVYTLSGRVLAFAKGEYTGNVWAFHLYDYIVPDDAGEEPAFMLLMDLSYTHDDNLLKSLDLDYYGPQEDGWYYERKRKSRERYEYDEKGRLICVRISGDYKQDEPLLKKEYSYDREQMTGWVCYLYETDHWAAKEQVTMTYAGELSEVDYYDVATGRSVRKETFDYNGGLLSGIVSSGDVTGKVSYTLNEEGYVTRIDAGNGQVMNIRYESGNGNFSLFTPLTERINGHPYIR